MAKKKVAPSDELGTTCGGCKWFGKGSEFHEVDHCNAMPPSILVDADGNPVSVRPSVTSDDQKCMLFMRRLDG